MKSARVWNAVVLSFLLSLPFSVGAFAQVEVQVHEASSMVQIFGNPDPETLIILDLDNTTFETTQTLGSNQWFDSVAKSLIESGMPPRDVYERLGLLWEKILTASHVKPVQEDTPYLIQRAQKAGQFVLGLTVRRPAFAEHTLRQLREIEVSFDLNPVHGSPLDLQISESPVHAARYQNGVIFGGPTNNKGLLLLEFLKKSGLGSRFKRIVFVDDKGKNAQDFAKALNGSGYDVSVFRYSAADSKVQKYDPELALFQFRFWQKSGYILPDVEAKALMEKSCEYFLEEAPWLQNI